MRRPTGTPVRAVIAAVSSRRKGDAPLAVVVPAAFRALPSDALDVAQHELAIERLTDVHPALAHDADRPVAQEMAEQAREGQGARAFVRAGKRKTKVAGAKTVFDLVDPGLVERRLEPHQYGVVREESASARTQRPSRAAELVIRGAHERPSVLERQRNALATTLIDGSRPPRDGESVVGRRAEELATVARRTRCSIRRAIPFAISTGVPAAMQVVHP